MTEDEKELLSEVAKSKGKSLEEVLLELGHIKPEPEEVTIEANLEEEAIKPKNEDPQVSAPIQVAEETTEEKEESFNIDAQPDIKLPPPAEEEVDKETEDEDELPATVNHICQNCGWNLDVPSTPEPEHKDKIAFLQAVLGQKVFSKKYSLFGGELKVSFRTLTIKEIDALYTEAFKAEKAGLIATTADYYEYLNRLRLYLQISSLSAPSSSLHISLPEGLSKETHPDVNTYWTKFLPELTEDQSLLSAISEYVVGKVLKTEHLQRVITHECNNFNKLVAKLEVCVDNKDFWKEIEQPS